MDRAGHSCYRCGQLAHDPPGEALEAVWTRVSELPCAMGEEARCVSTKSSSPSPLACGGGCEVGERGGQEKALRPRGSSGIWASGHSKWSG